MIRFIDLRGMSTGYRFAFFDTVTDSFVKVGSDQVWRDRADLTESLGGDPRGPRLLGFLPEWADTPAEDEDD